MSNQATHTGGCQCGAVRFRVDGGLGEATICYCRMCQKAVGGPFGFLVSVDRGRLTWTRGAAKRFASSNVAQRGFCGDCGTQLTWEHGERMDITVAAFDDAGAIVPTVHMALEGRYPWLPDFGLEVRTTDRDPKYASFLRSVRSYQHPDKDTDAWPPAGRAR